ncbi:hypothetical protein LTR49_003491 [Elasticomyces elasticus]|nr:hypothetical protein LTR49_003491 [Elasticomyces elasticus]
MVATTRGASSASRPSVVPAPLVLVPTPTTPSRSGRSTINEFLHNFCGHFDIEVPVHETVSPDKREQTLAHNVLKKIRPLFYRQKDALDHAFNDLKAMRPSVREQPNRLQILDRRLGEAVSSSIITPHSTRQTRSVSPMKICPREEDPTEAPPSPTLAVKHAPQQYPQPELQSKSATTSFATTAMNTSFVSDATSNMKTSFSTIATSAPASQDFLGSSWAQEEQDRLECVTAVKAKATQPAFAPGGVDGAYDVASTGQASIAIPLEDHHVRDIPVHGVAPVDVPDSMKSLRFDLLMEAYRVMRFCKLTPEEFEVLWPLKKRTTMESLWKLVDQHAGGRHFVKGGEITDYAGYTLSAKLKWAKGSKTSKAPIFDLDLRAPRKEASNAFQRKAGSDRILVVDLPDFERPLPLDFLNGMKNQIITRVLEMLEQDQPFLGRKWIHFHSKQKKGPEVDPEEASNHKVTFVAVEGYGIPNIDFVDFMTFAIPLCENLGQTACKAYSRIDLAMSRGKSVLVFDTDKIRWSHDEMSNGVLEDSRFNDPACEWPPRPAGMKPVEMTDGCGLVSRGVMKKVMQFYGLDYLPAAIQARICHSKGMWHWLAGDEDDDLWIMIRDSQRKLVRQDLNGDDEWRTLNVIGYSGPAKSSILYTGFIPILRDRGVPEDAILDFVRSQVDLEGEEFLAVLKSAPALHHWIFTQKDIWGARKANGGKITEVAGFPKSTDERILRMLEVGFEPLKCAYLKTQILESAEHIFNLKAKRFKVRLSKSTSVLGIPDVTGMLRPGEVHLQFSRPWPDPVSGQMRSSLNGVEVLVARNPSMDGSNIQKLRGVLCPELAHLYDVIVFSIHGPRPEAGKLSGGDYDGDTFWVCWEPSLVKHFKNAPAAWSPRSPEDLGIVKDTVTLGQALDITKTQRPTEAALRRWIQRGTAARMTSSMLPIVTLYHGKMTYHSGDISSPAAKLLVELHDYLVDSDKQGYQYDPQTFSNLKLIYGMPNSVDDPAHWRFTRKNGDVAGEAKRTKPGNCEDALYYGVVVPKILNILHLAKLATKDAVVEDPDLELTHDSYAADQDTVIKEELKHFPAAFKPIKQVWNDGQSRYMKTKKHDFSGWDKIAEQCHGKLVFIEPVGEANDPMIRSLTRRIGKRVRNWDDLRTSTLFKIYRFSTAGKFLFSIAGGDLCRMKAEVLGYGRGMRPDIYIMQRPQKAVDWTNLVTGDEPDEVDEDEDNEDMFDEGASMFDRSECQAILGAAELTATSTRKRKSNPSPEPSVKRQQSSPSTPSSSRTKQLKQPTTPVSTKHYEPAAQSMDWLTGTPPSGVGTASQRPEWLKRNN